jgi:hypothetical protein
MQISRLDREKFLITSYAAWIEFSGGTAVETLCDQVRDPI